MLAKHLPRIAEEHADPRVRELARRAHEHYLYPVDSQVYSSEGELLDQACANDLDGGYVLEAADGVYYVPATGKGKSYAELLEAPARARESAGKGGG